jgi:hypothetical protein
LKLLVTSQFHFHSVRLEMCQKPIFYFNQKRGGRMVTFVDQLRGSFSISMLNSDFASYSLLSHVVSASEKLFMKHTAQISV